MSGYALEIERVSKSFGALRVAREVSLALLPGARHALIGPNGAGKTTLVNLVTGLLQPSSGTIRLAGTDITPLTPERRVALGLARTFQISSLFPKLTVAENVGLALEARGGVDQRIVGRLRDRPEIVDGAAQTLDSLGLLGIAGRRIADLPYGQRRLVEIALVLALQPTTLLLDEPAAGLASADRHAVLDLLLRLPSSLTVLVIEHDMSLVFRLAQRITVMVEGEVMVEGAPAEIRSNEQVRDVYLGKRHHG
ncbi:MAG TPA: ABC transporter ATP-binding protein [Stellaceae bacterium]|nr:ABC transporter ATP-binding protein [Stellaceae bacterium]